MNILLDIDDTLFPSSDFSSLARKNALNAMIWMGIDEHFDYLYSRLQKIIREKGSNCPHHFDELCSRLEIKKPARYVAAAVASYHDTKTSIQPFPKVPSTLLKLKADGHRLFIATNGSSIKQWDKLIRLGLALYFEDVFVSEDIGQEKGQGFYKEVLSRLGSSARDCVMVGDREDMDIAPAKAVGMRTIRILKGKHASVPSIADHVIDEIEKISGILQNF
ncbi:HAD-IA family hydrolase [Candidatus Micrarchaeota archaeon]|nr:HAD-IA family hydrolase [Candidatus Micrarchaeota archaeon]